MDIDGHNNITESALNAGLIIAEPKKLSDGSEVLVIPAGAETRSVDEFLAKPRFVKQQTTHRTLASLKEYVPRFKTDETVIFADVESGHVTAIIDYHSENGAADNAAHRAKYTPAYSEEWRRWTGVSGKAMAQAAFALFIEENRLDIVEPSGADVLELAKTIEAKKSGAFKSGIRLDNGNIDLQFVEQTEGKAGQGGKLTIPSEIKLGIPVFYGGPKYEVTAFFRYRITEGVLSMQVDLHRMKQIRDAAFDEIVEDLRSLSVPIYEGTPS